MKQTSHKWESMLTIVTCKQPLLTYSQLAKQFNEIVAKRVLSLNLIVFMLQFAGLIISTLSTSIYPFWFASGTACGLIFMWGIRIVPGIFLGSFFAYFLAKAGLALAVIAAVIFTLQAWLLLVLSYRYVTLTLIFYERYTYFKFILLASVLTAISTSLLFIFSITHLHSSEPLLLQWLQWWLANLNGLLILSFSFLTLDAYFSQLPTLKKMNYLPIFGYYGMLILLIVSLLFCTHIFLAICLAFLILIAHSLTSARYGWCGLVTSAFIMALLFCSGALLYAPFFKAQPGLIGFIYIEILLFISFITPSLTKTGHCFGLLQ